MSMGAAFLDHGRLKTLILWVTLQEQPQPDCEQEQCWGLNQCLLREVTDTQCSLSPRTLSQHQAQTLAQRRTIKHRWTATNGSADSLTTYLNQRPALRVVFT